MPAIVRSSPRSTAPGTETPRTARSRRAVSRRLLRLSFTTTPLPKIFGTPESLPTNIAISQNISSARESPPADTTEPQNISSARESPPADTTEPQNISSAPESPPADTAAPHTIAETPRAARSRRATSRNLLRLSLMATPPEPQNESSTGEDFATLPIAARLHAVQAFLVSYGFNSAGELLLAELQCDDSHILRKSSRFVQSNCLGKILCAASNHASFSLNLLRGDIPLRARLVELVSAIIAEEMEALVAAPIMRKPVNQFTHEYISEFSSAALAQAQIQHAPTAKRLIDVMVSPLPLGCGSSHFDEPDRDIGAQHAEGGSDDDQEGGKRDSRRRSGRRRDLISISALCVAAYGRSQRANALQGMVGYYLSACDAGKRVIETLHCMGFSVTYESVLHALKANALAVREMLRQRARIHPFFVSFDNMVFYQQVKTHLMGNRQHQRHYTAGYIAFLEGVRGDGFLVRADMLDWNRAAEVNIADVMVNRTTLLYARDAAAANIYSVLYKHFRKSMSTNMIKHAPDGSVERYGYTPFTAPKLMVLDVKKYELYTMTAFSKNEAIINEVIEILRDIVRELDLPVEQLLDKVILFKGDYMTVRNIMKALYRRQEDESIHQMSFVEPVIGLFHLQMCILGTIYKAHWGNEDSRDPTSIKRFARMMGKPAIISPKIKDFRPYDAFFDELFDAHVIALAARLRSCETYEQLNSELAKIDWQKLILSMVDEVMPPGGGFSVVHRMRYDEQGAEAPPEQRDVIHENFLLFLQQGLVYRDFAAAVKAGDPGRLEHILSIWTTQLHGTQNINYPRELLHHMACLQRIWTPAFRDIWRHNCLVNPSGKIGAWVPDDLFGEYVVREIKAKIHSSSNRQSDAHLRETISAQVMSLYACKSTMHAEFRAKHYGTSSTLVSNSTDVSYIVRTLIKEDAALLVCGRRGDNGAHPSLPHRSYWQAQDMLAEGAKKLATGLPLRDYKMRARFNWHRYGGVGEDPDTVEGEGELEREGEGEDDILGVGASLDDLL